jgi:hypothetical protein
MKLKRGCGCLLLVLALINLILLVSGIVAATGGSTNWRVTLVIIAVMGANMAVCVMLGLASLRGAPAAGVSDEVSDAEQGDSEGGDEEVESEP